MRLAVGLLMTWLVVVTQSAKAGDCVPAGPPPKLDNESVYWSIVIASGQTCLRGLRSGTMIIESVAISAPAKSGEATVQDTASPTGQSLARQRFRDTASRTGLPAISRARIHFQ